MNMTEIIKSGNPLSNTDIIQVIVDVMEEKGIKVCSCYMDGNDIYGVYINSIFDGLSFLRIPQRNIYTDIDGHNIYFVELGALLRYSYQHGSMKMYSILSTNTDIDCDIDESYQSIVELVTENPPLHIGKLRLLNMLDTVLDDDYDGDITLNEVTQLVDDFNKVDDIGFSVTSDNDIEMRNQLNKFRQELKTQEYKKVSEKKINEIDHTTDTSNRLLVIPRIK